MKNEVNRKKSNKIKNVYKLAHLHSYLKIHTDDHLLSEKRRSLAADQLYVRDNNYASLKMPSLKRGAMRYRKTGLVGEKLIFQ